MVLRVSYFCFYLAVVAILGVVQGCRTSNHLRNAYATTDQVIEDPLVIPTDTLQPEFAGLEDKSSVARYYQLYGCSPVWVNGKDRSLADSMLTLIHNAQYYGFATASYHLKYLESSTHDISRSSLSRKELLLTDAFLSFTADIKFGLQNRAEKRNEDSLRVALLNTVVTSGSLIKNVEKQEPEYPGYKQLKATLRLFLDSIKEDHSDSAKYSDMVRLIAINMERWRRETHALKNRYIFINIPSFMMQLVDRDSIVSSSKIIVGTPANETPVLSSAIECFTIYPYWHVPKSISVKEYLPILKRDTSFLRRNNFEVLNNKGKVVKADTIDWRKFSEKYFPVRLRQREGTENSLGIIKFIFDNPYAVFLHDTNAKRLFKSNARAFSHGCIRLEKAAELAHYLVTGSVGVASKTVSKYLNEKQQRWIDLKKPIPIHTRYFTCEIINGKLMIYKDIYSKDQAIADLIYGRVDKLDL